MSKNINKLKLPLKKLLETGKVDSWLRGISKITPKAIDIAKTSVPIAPYDMNTHVVSYNTPLSKDEIRMMSGFINLMKACSQKKIKIDVQIIDDKALKVRFDPTKPFSKSVVFGSSYAQVLPFILTPKNMALFPH